MSSRPCPHCNATGRCQCVDCSTPTLGHERARELDNARNLLAHLDDAPHLRDNPLVRLLAIWPARATVAQHQHQTFTCCVCNGLGFNYIGRRNKKHRRAWE